MRVEVYAEICCPFAHVGLRRLCAARAVRGADVGIRVRAWPLEWINGVPLDPTTVAHEVEALRDQVAPDLFAHFDPANFPRTSIPAFGLAAAAYQLDDGVGEAVSLALRDALFEEGRDISDAGVLHDVGSPFGVEPLDNARAIERVRADWERGRARSVVGSPHFFFNGRDWFCPTLRIQHTDAQYTVSAKEGVEDFYAALGERV